MQDECRDNSYTPDFRTLLAHPHAKRILGLAPGMLAACLHIANTPFIQPANASNARHTH